MSDSNSNSLFPIDYSQQSISQQRHLSTASSIGGIYDAYNSDDASADPIAITTAHRRNSSPVPFLETGSAATTAGRSAGSPTEESGSGLHRRGSSRVRVGKEKEKEKERENRRESTGLRGPRDFGSSRGVGGSSGHGAESSFEAPTRRGQRRSHDKGSSIGIGSASDDTENVVRPFPRRPDYSDPIPASSSSRNSNRGVSFDIPTHSIPISPDDPLQSTSYSQRTRHHSAGTTFSMSTADSHPFSLDLEPTPTNIGGEGYYSEDDDEEVQAFASAAALPAGGSYDPNEGGEVNYEEEPTVRSPLHTSKFPPRSTSKKAQFLSSSVAGSSPSPSTGFATDGSPRSFNSNSSPSSSQRRNSQSAYPRGSPLGRKNTLTSFASNGLRRMSLRVVNLAGNSPTSDSERIEHLVAGNEERIPDGKAFPHTRMRDFEGNVGLGVALDEDEGKEADVPEEKVDRRIGGDLRGRTLFIFGPENWIRRSCASVLRLRWTEPIILLCILLSVIILTIQSAPDVYTHPRPTRGYFHSWEDYALFGLFSFFTLEIIARIIVTGFIFNPPPLDGSHQVGPVETMKQKLSGTNRPGLNKYPPPPHTAQRPPMAETSSYDKSMLATKGYSSVHGNLSAASLDEPPVHVISLSRSRSRNNGPHSSPFSKETTSHPLPGTNQTEVSLRPANGSKFAPTGHTPFVLSIRKQRSTYHHAFLRHSWNRVDFVAVVSFWIAFILAGFGSEQAHNLYFFRALSVLRATRLLAVTSGTSTILQSLKKASPQLVNVAFFVVFAMTMFSIVGVQSFKGSYRRTCEWSDPTGVYDNVTSSQRCGGFIDPITGAQLGFIVSATGQPSPEGAKGFICPNMSTCIESGNPDNGAISFDNIVAALLQVVVVASANTWSTVTWDMMDADFFVSFLFFIVCLIVLNYWLINMFVAVITNTFASIRDETKHSAFASSDGTTIDALGDNPKQNARGFSRGMSFVRRAYDTTQLFWVAAIVADIGLQASKTFDMTSRRADLLDSLELFFTIGFDVEMLIRAFATLPDWRAVFTEPRNAADGFIAIMTSIIQIPVIHNSPAYPWLTIFQIARFYRVILAIPRMKKLLLRVLGTFSGLVNMILFLMMMNFISALIAVQLLRGIPNLNDIETPEMTFYQIFNSFLAMYQILSSENWTDVLNNALTSEVGVFQTFICAVFLAGWMLFAYFILINMFIAVINENFAIVEEEKHKQQLQAFVERSEPQMVVVSWFRRFNPYHYLQPRPKAVNVENIPSNLVLPMKKAVVRDYMTERSDEKKAEDSTTPGAGAAFVAKARRALRLSGSHEQVAMEDITSPTDSVYQGELFPTTAAIGEDQENTQGILGERRALQNDFITAHPSYDRSLWVFGQKNPLRRFCQRLVGPAFGDERIRGREPVRRDRFIFQLIIFATIVASIAIAGIATPLYRRNYFMQHGQVRWTWFNLSEISLGLVFIVEFLVKVVADGFVFAPNAYLLSIWNDLDFFVLITLIVNITTALISPGGMSRFTRSLKAFRALRLINLSETMRQTFYNVLIVGAGRIMDAGILAVLYIMPFAVWGQNIFGGLLYFCNDTSVTTKAECAGEFLNSPVSDWNVLTPRVWANPYVWTFDSFRGALLILFEIISLEGWVSVMESVMQITGRDLQPQQDYSQFNSLFFVAYNLVGAVFILTIFVSVIIESFTRRSGTSLLTTEQRQWIDLRKLITRQRPAKRPKARPEDPVRAWCFDRAIAKHGWWSRMMTGLYLVHIVVLMTQATTNPVWADSVRNYVFLGFTLIYFVDIGIRVIGLGWNSYSQNGWNIFDVLVVSGTFATTIPILLGTSNQAAIQLQKLFVVSIAFKLVQKNNSLNQLFKTAAASLPAIMNIFALWAVLFLVWAIMYLEIFGLTRWGQQGARNANYSTFWKALVMLAIQSTGEGWNGFMHDYTIEYPYCTADANYLLSDCGSAGWAFALFITWNVLSMYLMSNLILGAVVENFSYVFQVYGKVTSINREEMRAFKKTWADFDTTRSGYLKQKDIVSFFRRLSGIFEVKIYPEEWSIANIKSHVVREPSDPHILPFVDPGPPRNEAEAAKRRDLRYRHMASSIDVRKLSKTLSNLDRPEVVRRKHLYNRLYHEAMIDSEGPRGISFNNMLLLLAHYRLIDDERALRLEEQIQRREKLEKVMDRVNGDSVRSLLRTIVLRRQFVARREEAKKEAMGLPAIIVDSEGPPDSPGADGYGAPHGQSSPSDSPSSPTRRTVLTPGSVSEDEDYFDRSAGSYFVDRSGSISLGASRSSPRRQSVTSEQGEELVGEMMGKWGSAFAQDDDDL